LKWDGHVKPYIIFSLARTGSTTLLRLLNCRQGIRCFFEPFNPDNREPRLAPCRGMVIEKGLAPTVQWLWTGCNGFKHVWKPGGWPFLENPDLNRQLLVEVGARIVLLHRRNALRRAISIQISEQMQLWTPSTAEEFRRIREHHFRALDIPALRVEMQSAQEELDGARQHLKNANISWREITYEDFFEPRLSIDARLEAVQSLLEFLEAGRATDRELIAMRTYLNPAVTGFQNVDSYTKIPNIHEVERALGSAQSGFVFDPARAPG
jgi:hypothetical protein